MILNANPNGANAIQEPNGTVSIGHMSAGSSSSGGYKLNFLGWSVLLLGLYAINGTKTGHEIIFYCMVLIVLFLFVYNYQKIMPILTKKA